MKAGTFMQTLVWCCSSCGFVHHGGQPFMECPICEAYKTSFIDIPQHIEAAVIAEFGADGLNSAGARQRRRELVREGGYARTFRLKGRVTEAVNRDGASRRPY